jgi:hypothetical protein
MKPERSIIPEREPVEIAKRVSFSPKVRAQVLLANGGRCYLTGQKIAAGEAWEVEHVIPLAQGGTNDLANLRPALKAAHKIKSANDAANTAKARRLAGETCQGRGRLIPSRGFSDRTRGFDGQIKLTRKAMRYLKDQASSPLPTPPEAKS